MGYIDLLFFFYFQVFEDFSTYLPQISLIEFHWPESILCLTQILLHFSRIVLQPSKVV